VNSTLSEDKMSNFCNKIFRHIRSAGGQNPRFPMTLLVIVTTVLRAACDQEKV